MTALLGGLEQLDKLIFCFSRINEPSSTVIVVKLPWELKVKPILKEGI
jgi:hypothetical protein